MSRESKRVIGPVDFGLKNLNERIRIPGIVPSVVGYASNAMNYEFEVRATISGQRRSVVGRASEIGGSGIVLVLPVEVAPGETVELEMADSRLSGQVLRTQLLSSDFETLIQVRSVVLGNTELASILQRILLEALPDISGLEPTETRFD